jgi:hypothetical protein
VELTLEASSTKRQVGRNDRSIQQKRIEKKEQVKMSKEGRKRKCVKSQH